MNPSLPLAYVSRQVARISVQPAPGAVFLKLSKEVSADPPVCLFIEMTVGEALTLRRVLDECIGVAATAAGP